MQQLPLPTSQQQAQFVQSSSNEDNAYKLQIHKITVKVRQSMFFKSSSKHVRIRLEKWIQELSKYQFNAAWRTNKLNYLKMLDFMCQCQLLLSPFTAFPNARLPILKKHQINNINNILQRQFKLNKVNNNRLAKISDKEENGIKACQDNKSYRQNFKIILPSTNNHQLQKSNQSSFIEAYPYHKIKLSLPSSKEKTKKQIRSSHPKISPATTISSQAWKASNSKLLISKTFHPKNLKLGKFQYQCAHKKERQYWQSNSQIGSGTPKYLHQYNNAVNVILSEDEEKTHRSQTFCDCIDHFWG